MVRLDAGFEKYNPCTYLTTDDKASADDIRNRGNSNWAI